MKKRVQRINFIALGKCIRYKPAGVHRLQMCVSDVDFVTMQLQGIRKTLRSSHQRFRHHQEFRIVSSVKNKTLDGKPYVFVVLEMKI